MLGRPGLDLWGKFWDPHTICEDPCSASQGPAHRFRDLPSFVQANFWQRKYPFVRCLLTVLLLVV